MIKFAIFFLSFLANLVIVKMIPEEFFRVYINVYTLVGGSGALTFFLMYAQEKSLPYIKKSGLFLLFFYAIMHLFLDGFWAAASLYPLMIIYNDYIVTQSNFSRSEHYYRLFVIVSTLPFVLFPQHFEVMFQFRVFLIALALLIYSVRANEFYMLKVKSTGKYIFFNYTFYYIPLLFITNANLAPFALKVWYVFCQGGLVVYLRYLDFTLRKGNMTSRNVDRLILICAMCAPAVPFYLFPSGIATIAYFIGLLGLVHSRRYQNLEVT